MNSAKTWWIGLGALVAIALLSAATAGGMMGGGMMGPGMMWGYGGQAGQPGFDGWGWALGMGLGMLAMCAFWGALIVGIALLVRGAVGPSATRTETEDAGEILRRRYAAGEIDEVTYERMRQKIAA